VRRALGALPQYHWRPVGDATRINAWTGVKYITGRSVGARVRTRDAAVVGTVERLAWARGLDRPWPGPRDGASLAPFAADLRNGRTSRRAGLATVGAGQRLQLGRVHVQCGGGGWTSRCVAVGAGEWVRLGRGHVLGGGRGGHPVVLQWARANGCDWNEDTSSGAAGAGHLRVLQWARGNGCDWDDFTCTKAAGGGHHPCCASVGAGQRLRLGRRHVLGGGGRWTP
jgi:hypothetical protein